MTDKKLNRMNTANDTRASSLFQINRSFRRADSHEVSSAAASRTIIYGDKIFVSLVRRQYGNRTLAEFTLSDVNDFSEIYGELRRYTRECRGLAQLYVRNVTRGWSISRPFMLYGETPRIASSVTRPVAQPAATSVSHQREIPESVRLRYRL